MLMEFLATEYRMMNEMVASTRQEHARFMAYFRQEQLQGSLPAFLPFPQSLTICEVYDEFSQNGGVLLTSSLLDCMVNNNFVAEEDDLT